MFLLALILSLVGTAASTAQKCSSGNPRKICRNINACWKEMGFNDINEMINLCSFQGYDFVVITKPPQNITIPEGAKASFKCSADNTIQIKILKLEDIDDDFNNDHRNPTTQSTEQEIEEAREENEGWYACVAYSKKDKVVETAYLEIRDACEVNPCKAPKQCKPDMYTGGYNCVCESACSEDYNPVCGSDCNTYGNECMMKKETCEKGLVGISVLRTGMCDFDPEYPELFETPENAEFDEGAQINFKAGARGTPEPLLKWFVGDKEVGLGNEFVSQMSAALRGNWRVEASNCYTNVAEHSFNLNMRALTATEPQMQCCKVYGDPHIITFDGKEYDNMGSCTYVLAQEESNALWSVYGTFKPCGDKKKQLSCIISITVLYKDEVLQFLRMYRINYKGEEFAVPVGQSRNIGDMKVENRAMKYFITLGDTGVVVQWDGIITSEICLPTKCGKGVIGLCANADCDIANEFNRRGTMNQYTRSWEAQTSSEFGNSWAVDPTGCDLEPEDGSLPATRTRPCSVLSAEEQAIIRARCEAVIRHSAFETCTTTTTIDTEMLLANCMFDSCGGMEYGGACGEDCSVKTKAKIDAAILNGMSTMEARVKYEGPILDAACVMGLTLSDKCSQWGLYVSYEWRVEVFCPSDDELVVMNMCSI